MQIRCLHIGHWSSISGRLFVSWALHSLAWKINAPVDSSTKAPELFQIQSNILGRGLTAIKASTTWKKEMTRKMDISVFSTPNSWDFWKLFKNIRPHSRAIQMEDGKHSNLQMHQFIEEMSKAYFVSKPGSGCAMSFFQFSQDRAKAVLHFLR